MLTTGGKGKVLGLGIAGLTVNHHRDVRLIGRTTIPAGHARPLTAVFDKIREIVRIRKCLNGESQNEKDGQKNNCHEKFLPNSHFFLHVHL